ncbi:MAG: theronine dehydrogenase [Ruminococcaceae bacterium]|nr:theronine dehydrogenase [Oscillospiraceae bacterium]
MKTKSIIFSAPGKAELIEQEIPTPGKGEVIVRIEVTSVSSGTERANVSGDANVSIGKNDVVKFPRQSGYSSAGIVEAVGEDVTNVKAGDRVAAVWSKHSRYNRLPATNVFKIGDNVTFEEGALFHIATFPLAAIRKCRLEIGESALVMGLGILGMMAVRLLKLAGAVPIVAVDPIKERREKALSYGADYAFDPFEEDFDKKVKEVTNGGANVAIEVTGVGKGLDGALDCMARFGRVALLGCTRNSDFTIDYYRKVHGPGITLIGAHTVARPKFESSEGMWTVGDDMKTLIKLSETGRIDLSDMIEDTRVPEEAPEVYTRLINDKGFPTTQFNWRGV